MYVTDGFFANVALAGSTWAGDTTQKLNQYLQVVLMCLVQMLTRQKLHLAGPIQLMRL